MPFHDYTTLIVLAALVQARMLGDPFPPKNNFKNSTYNNFCFPSLFYNTYPDVEKRES